MLKRRLNSFGYAWRGLLLTVRTQWNMRFHIFAAAVVLFTALWLEVSREEWTALLLAIGLVIVSECINTAIEYAVDLVTLEQHPLAAKAKDVAAGAVLMAAIIAIGIGGIVFGPYLLPLFSR